MGKLCETYLQSSEVDHAVDVGVGCEDLIQTFLVGDIDLVELGSFLAQQLDAVDGDLGGIVETVDDDDLVAMVEQGEGGERANVARAPGRNG